ncbi:hypothetical protein EDD15DRAFT_2335553, partial [Pisolithus albus]
DRDCDVVVQAEIDSLVDGTGANGLRNRGLVILCLHCLRFRTSYGRMMLTLHCALKPLLAGGFKGKKGAKRLNTKLFGENGLWIQIVGHRVSTRYMKISTSELESERGLSSETPSPHLNVLGGVVDLMSTAVWMDVEDTSGKVPRYWMVGVGSNHNGIVHSYLVSVEIPSRTQSKALQVCEAMFCLLFVMPTIAPLQCSACFALHERCIVFLVTNDKNS